ncbi:MAG: NADPH-dependent 7-cyano-7-deazaguanine reductase QueF [Pseudomonadales bacterium]|nr:NADPH-dependent 7-cyano-7-deazaguanine reductase QueF [Pseudomonadales bacterium]
MNNELHAGPLGEASQYAEGYSSTRLFPMPRTEGRQAVGLMALPDWHGQDTWTGFEFSWLNERGKPKVAVLRLTVPARSSHIVESKSMKLYLNGFAQTHFDSLSAVSERLTKDLGTAFGGDVDVELLALADSSLGVSELKGECLDELDVEITDYQRNADLLVLTTSNGSGDVSVTQELTTHLFRSLCPVTAQPDWASVLVSYTGAPIDRAGLLKYLVSYRQHQAFHETTIERIYADIWERCQPKKLSVSGRFLRRGGLDINPTRSSESRPSAMLRLSRQ